MKILLRNTINGLVPLFPADYENKKKLRLGEDYEAEIKRPRNVGFHRKYFSLLNVGYENTKLDMPFETYRKYVTMKAGYFKAYDTPRGVFYDAESISFANMDEDTFDDLYQRVIDVIIKDLGTDRETIDKIIEFV